MINALNQIFCSYFLGNVVIVLGTLGGRGVGGREVGVKGGEERRMATWNSSEHFIALSEKNDVFL